MYNPLVDDKRVELPDKTEIDLSKEIYDSWAFLLRNSKKKKKLFEKKKKNSIINYQIINILNFKFYNIS